MAGRVLLAVSLVAVLVGGGLWLAFGRNSPASQVSKDPAAVNRERVDWLRWSCGLPFPENTEVVEWDNRSGRDMEAWSLLRVRPDQVPEIKQGLLRLAESPSHRWKVDDSDTNTLKAVARASPDRHPTWWLPEQLPDPDVLLLRRADGIFVVLSAKTGLVYLLQWSV